MSSMNPATICKTADEMGVARKLALWHRCNFLKSEIRKCADKIVSFDLDDPVARAMARIEQDTVFLPLAKELRAVALAMRGDEPKPGAITDEMIEQARQFPITNLIHFTRGAALAFCHPDKKPSMTHFIKGNRAHCWPCGKSYDPIGVLMTRDGMNFKDAVRQLSRG